MKAGEIFVVGMDRAGTKWLTSILAKHSKICTPPCDRGGAHESNLYEFSCLFPDITRHDEYIAMATLFQATDMYKDMNLPEDFLFKLEPRPRNYSDLIRVSLNKFAEQENAQFWIQKAPPVAIELLNANFHSAFFIVIKRNIIDNIRSKKAMRLRFNIPFSIIGAVLTFCIENRQMDQLIRTNNNVATVEYEKMVSPETANQIPAKLIKHFHLPPENIPLQNKENSGHSSFRSASERDRILSASDELIIKWGARLCGILPLTLLKLIRMLGRKNKGTGLVYGTFLYLSDKYRYNYGLQNLSDTDRKK